MKRLGLFFFFDGSGCVDKYIEFMLKELKKSVETILVVVNGKVNASSQETFNKLADKVLIRENTGYDVWAYKDGIEYLGYDYITQYDEFILMNYTNFGPIYPFEEMFQAMEERQELDFWGLSKSWGNKQDIPQHIQSHFIVVRNKMLKSKHFKTYWDNVPQIKCYNDALYKHEFVFTDYFAKKGYKWDVYLNIDEYEDSIANPLLVEPYKMLKEKRTPLIKRKSFFLDPDWLFNAGLKNNIVETLQHIKEKTNYDVMLIWHNMLRTQKLYTLKWTMGLDYITKNDFVADIKKSSVILLDLYNVSNLDRIINEYENVIEEYPLYIRVIDRKKCTSVKQISLSHKAELEIFDCTEQSKIEEMQRKFEFVFYINDRGVKSNLTDAFRLYTKENFDNIFSSKNSIYHLESIIAQKDEIGCLCSELGCNSFELDDIWEKNYDRVAKMSNAEGITLAADRKKPPIYVQKNILVVRASLINEYFKAVELIKKYDIDEQLVGIVFSIIIQNVGYASGFFCNEKYYTDLMSQKEYDLLRAKNNMQVELSNNIYDLKCFNFKEMVLINLKYLKEKKDMIKKIIKGKK